MINPVLTENIEVNTTQHLNYLIISPISNRVGLETIV